MVTEFGQDALGSALEALVGARVVEVRRTLNIAIVGLTRGDESVRLHAQCPFRMVYNNRVILGSTDMHYPRAAEAYDRYETHYDRSASKITALLAAETHVVTAASLGLAGAVHLQCTERLQFDVLPAVGGPIECWRLFAEGSDEHYVCEPGRTT
jgi:hypothetical protein